MSENELPVTPRTGVALPSERYRISGIPEGLTSFPDGAHISRAGEVLAELSSFLQRLSRAGGQDLAVRFCHALMPIGLPPNLFGFHVWSVDQEGHLIEPLGGDDELSFAVIINQPVELQLESAISFLYQLAQRQQAVAAVGSGEGDILNLPEQAVAADRAAAHEVAERFRYGWREAARGAVDALAAAGFSLSVRYEVDVFPRREDLDRRLTLLRRLYNEIEPVRRSIDRIVGTIGGRGGSVRGGTEAIRGWTQQQLALLDIRRYANHALRDAEVCGNGYLVFNDYEPFAPYAGRPEDVRVGSRGVLELREEHGWVIPGKPILHVRGIDQIHSPYGMSMLEPFMYAVYRFDQLGQVRDDQQEMLRSYSLTADQARELEAKVGLVERILKTTTADVTAMLRFFYDEIAEPERPLYLPGHELYR
jgi:hypothetical protein